MTAIAISTQALKKSVLRHCGEVDDGTSFYDQNGQVMDYLNKAHVSILGGGNEFDFELSKPWSWAVVQNPSVLILQPTFNGITQPPVGGVTIAYNSANVLFTVAPPISLKGYRLHIFGRPDFMRVVNHVAGSTVATIDAPYADSRGAVNMGFEAILIDYQLSNPPNGILRLTQSMVLYHAQDLQGDEEQKLNFIDESQMARDYPLKRVIAGTPNFFCITKKDANGNYFIKIEKAPVYPTRVEYKFIPIPDPLVDSCNNFPIIPVEHRDCLDFAASYFLCLDKNDDRAQMYFQLTQQKLKGMLKAEEKQKIQTSKTRGKLFARGDLYQRGKRYQEQETS
jgi:hypothetical protein